jgi:hypothetical protein
VRDLDQRRKSSTRSEVGFSSLATQRDPSAVLLGLVYVGRHAVAGVARPATPDDRAGGGRERAL